MRKTIILFVTVIIILYSILSIWFGYFSSLNTINSIRIKNLQEKVENTLKNSENISKKELQENLSKILKEISLLEVSKEIKIKKILSEIITTLLITLALLTLTTFIIVKTITKPLKDLTKFIKEIDFSKPSPPPSFKFKDINSLSQTFQEMLSKLQEYQNKLKELERIEGWKEIAKIIVHEINNILSPVKTEIENAIIQKDISIEKVKTISKQLHNINEFTLKLKELYSLPNPTLQKTNLLEVVKDISLTFKTNLQIEGNEDDFILNIDKTLMNNAIINLVKNATEISSNVTINCYSSNDKVIVEVENEGEIPEEKIEKLFKLNFSTKGEDRGIGLTLTKKIILDHGGTIFAISRDGITKFIITLNK